jgi:hypothetical protein
MWVQLGRDANFLTSCLQLATVAALPTALVGVRVMRMQLE